MRLATKALIASLVLLLGVLFVPASWAQITTPASIVTLNATLTESLTLNVTGGAAVNFPTFAANTAVNAGNTASTVLTSWVLKPGRTQMTVWAWVANGAAALTDGTGNNIPASAVTAAAAGSGSAGGALNAVASGGAGVPAFITPAAATGVQIGSVGITGVNKNGNTTTTLTWNINTTGIQLPAATYTGTVNIQAQATP